MKRRLGLVVRRINVQGRPNKSSCEQVWSDLSTCADRTRVTPPSPGEVGTSGYETRPRIGAELGLGFGPIRVLVNRPETTGNDPPPIPSAEVPRQVQLSLTDLESEPFEVALPGTQNKVRVAKKWSTIELAIDLQLIA